MGPMSRRADRFFRQVFLKTGEPASPEQKESAKRMQRLMEIRRRATAKRKGY